MIWHFLKTCHERGWIYKGHDVMPWCPRCGTGISEHEIVTEGYQDRTHLSVFVKFPLLDQVNAALIAWTTTPWTLAANVAAAVNPELTYLEVAQDGWTYYVAQEAAKTALRGEYEVVREIKGSDLVGRPYGGPFDDLPAAVGIQHRVIAWDDVSATEGTGIVHIAPGCGKEDFALSKVNDLAVIAPSERVRDLCRRVRLAERSERARGRRADHGRSQDAGRALSRRELQAPLSGLLALRDGSGLPAGR